MTNDGPFSLDEIAMIDDNPAAKAHMNSAPADKTIGQLRAEVREILKPATIWHKLNDVRERHFVALGPKDGNVMLEAVTELKHADLVTTLRPVSELRQEAYARFGRRTNSSPYRWVMLWRNSGYKDTPRLEGIAGRRAPPGYKFAEGFVGYDGERLTGSGVEPSFFSELPIGALRDVV